MPTALEGITVVDFTRGFPGTLVAMVLADNGAEVVRVEPRSGDPLRAKAAFPMWRRGQKSVALDLHTAEGQTGAARLAARADIVVQNWRPTVAEELGLGYKQLSTGNGGLIYCHMTGFGTRGKYAGVKAYDGIVGAKSGRFTTRATRLGTRGRPGPTFFLASPHPSYGAAQHSLHGILAALYVREKTGAGQKVETTLVQGQMSFDVWDGVTQYLGDEYPDAYPVSAPVSASGTPLSPYHYMLLTTPSKDGRWFQFANVGKHLWAAFVKTAGLEWIYDDPMLKTAPHFDSEEASNRFWEILIEAMRSKTFDEWAEIFLPEVNVAFDQMRTTDDSRNHPQMRINGHVIDVVDPDIGPMQQIGPIVKLWETPSQIVPGAPKIGQHNALVSAGNGHQPHPNAAALPARPLEGVTILELATFFAAPYGVTLLAELGARVIKVEPAEGDPIRFGMPIPETGGVNVLSSKESVAVDFTTEEGRRIVYEIAGKADMVMCSFRAGVPERLKLDYESLRQFNPNLIYHRGVAYGLEGPFAPRPVYGPTPPAILGEVLYQLGNEKNVPPPSTPLDLDTIKDVSNKLRQMNAGMGDPIAALALGTGMLLALLARARTGKAQQSMTTMIGSCGYLMSDDFVWFEGKPEREGPDAELWGMGPLYRIYAAKEGHVFLACPKQDEWERLCATIAGAGAANLANDPRFATAAARAGQADALAEALLAAFALRTAQEWEDALLAADVACVAVNTEPFGRFVLRDAIMRENGFAVPDDHFALGPIYRHGVTVKLSRTPAALKPIPSIGGQTVKVLRELGYTDESIAALCREGVADISNCPEEIPNAAAAGPRRTSRAVY